MSTKQRRIAALAEYYRAGRAEHVGALPGHGVDERSLWASAQGERARGSPVHQPPLFPSASSVDGQTVAEYGCALEKNLGDLIGRAKSGSYKAPPVRRVHIPKGDGKETRPLGMPTVEEAEGNRGGWRVGEQEDKILQRAVVMLLEPICEREFCDFSYGFRPGRSAHQALKAIWQGINRTQSGWVVDVDIRAFFDTLDHQVLMGILQKRVKDGVILKLAARWLKAGVMEAGAL